MKSDMTSSPFSKVIVDLDELMSTTLELGLKLAPESVASLYSQSHKSES